MCIKEIYVCSGVYHLFQSVYLASKSDNEKILLYDDTAGKNISVHIFSEYFDKIIYVKKQDDILPIRLLKRCYYAGHLFFLSKSGRECSDKKKKYRVYVFNDYDLLANKVIQVVSKRKESIILVEEGLMTYSTNQYWLSIKRRPYLDKLLGIKIEGLAEHNHAIDTIMCQHPERMPEIKTKGRKIIKIQNMFLDRIWTSQMIHKIGLEMMSDEGFTALWLGQPLNGCGVEESEELETIRLIASLFKGHFRFIIKAHPRDRNGKYKILESNAGISVIDSNELSWIPAELLFLKLRPQFVLTVCSSAGEIFLEYGQETKLIYCAKIMGIKLEVDDVLTMLKGKNKFLPDNLEELKEIVADQNCYS